MTSIVTPGMVTPTATTEEFQARAYPLSLARNPIIVSGNLPLNQSYYNAIAQADRVLTQNQQLISQLQQQSPYIQSISTIPAKTEAFKQEASRIATEITPQPQQYSKQMIKTYETLEGPRRIRKEPRVLSDSEAEFHRAWYEEDIKAFRDRPIEQASLVGLGFVIPPALSLASKGIKALGVSQKALGIAGKGGGSFLAGLYAGEKTGELVRAETLEEKGRISESIPREITLLGIGGYASSKVIPSTIGFFRTLGKERIPSEAIIDPQIQAGKSFPTIRSGQALLKEFETGGAKLPGEAKPLFWHATPEAFKYPSEIKPGTSELPGLYGAPYVSPHFLKTGSGYKPISFNIFEDTLGKPEIIAIAPKGFELTPIKSRGLGKRKQAKEFLETEAQEEIAYIPYIKTEKEAILTPGQQLIKIGSKYYIEYKGVRVPITQAEVKGLGVKEPNKSPVGFSSEAVSRKGLINPFGLGVSSYKPETSSYVPPVSSSYFFPFTSSGTRPGSSSNLVVPSRPKIPITSYIPYVSKVSSTYRPSYSRPFYSPRRYSYPTFRPRIPEKDYFAGPKFTRRKKETLNPLFQTYIKRFGKWKPIANPLTRGRSLKLGSLVTLKNLGASFKIVPTSKTTTSKDIYFQPPRNLFRNYKIKKGKKIPLLNEFIQRRGKRLGSRTEVQEIQQARRGLIKW